MKKFLTTTLIFFCLPFMFITILEVVILPPNFFTYSIFSAIVYNSNFPHIGNFYPNVKLESIEEGDLGHHTIYSIPKKSIWITDKFGYRNNEFIEQADILLIGDSFIHGGGLTQEQTITRVLSSRFSDSLKVYNFAVANLSDFDCFLKKGFIKKPKMIIFEKVERNNVSEIILFNNKKSWEDKLKIINKIVNDNGLSVLPDRFLKFSFFNWCSARLKDKPSLGIPSPVDSKMLFLQGKKAIQRNENDLKNNVNVISIYKKYCDSLEIEFLYLPIPNKESVYYKLVPFQKQPNYLFKLDSLLSKSNIPTVNTLKVYNEWILKNENNKELLYHYDDSHWNANGVNIVADELEKLIRGNKKFNKIISK